MARRLTDKQIATKIMGGAAASYEKINPRRVFYESRSGRWRYIGRAHDYSAFDEDVEQYKKEKGISSSQRAAKGNAVK